MRAIVPAAGPSLARSALLPLGGPVARAVARLNQRRDVARLDGRIDLERAREDESGLVGHRQRLKRIALEKRVDRLGEPQRARPPWRERRARTPLSRPRV